MIKNYMIMGIISIGVGFFGLFGLFIIHMSIGLLMIFGFFCGFMFLWISQLPEALDLFPDGSEFELGKEGVKE